MTLPVALTISGYDPTGGSGVNADLKTFQNLNVYGMSAITSLTAQNSQGIQEILDIPDDFLEKQLKSIFEDSIPFTMKSGMITSIHMIETITKYVKNYHIPFVVDLYIFFIDLVTFIMKSRRITSIHMIETITKYVKIYHIPFVVDPYIFSRDGERILSQEATAIVTNELLHHAAVVTPNLKEAESFTGIDIQSEKDIDTAAKIFLREIGVKAVIINDSNITGKACDYLFTKNNSLTLTEEIVDTKSKRGSGSTFSAVITAEIAKGNSLEDAFRKAKRYVTLGLQNSLDIGKKGGPINHFIDIE